MKYSIQYKMFRLELEPFSIFIPNKMICGSITQNTLYFEYYFERNLDRFS